MKLFGIFGAGGFGREVMPLAEAMLQVSHPYEKYHLVFIDEHPESEGINDHLIITPDEFLAHQATERFFNIAIANAGSRRKMADLMMHGGAKPFAIKALNRVELANNEIEYGAIFCSYTTVTSNAKIGKFFHANIYSYIAHDCMIGDYVTFAPNVHCNGNVVIEDDVYIGTGALIKQGTPEHPIIIGKGAIIGMGAVVTKSISPYQTVVGNPARPIPSKEIKLS